MKSEIFSNAIKKRTSLRFLYGLSEIVIDPYYIGKDKLGNKVIYGKIDKSSEVKKFEYKLIANIRILNKKRFSPIIPIIS